VPWTRTDAPRYGRMRRNSSIGSSPIGRSKQPIRPLTRLEAGLKGNLDPIHSKRQTDVLLRLGEAPESAERDGRACGTVWLTSRNSAKIRPNHTGKSALDGVACVIYSTDERGGRMWRGSCENSGRSAMVISPQRWERAKHALGDTSMGLKGFGLSVEDDPRSFHDR
jgi:hypothetical protein